MFFYYCKSWRKSAVESDMIYWKIILNAVKNQQEMNTKFITKQMVYVMFMLCWGSAIKQKFVAYGFVYVGNRITIHYFFLLNNVWLWELKLCLWIMNHELLIRTLILMVILSYVHALHIWQKTWKNNFWEPEHYLNRCNSVK